MVVNILHKWCFLTKWSQISARWTKSFTTVRNRDKWYKTDLVTQHTVYVGRPNAKPKQGEKDIYFMFVCLSSSYIINYFKSWQWGWRFVIIFFFWKRTIFYLSWRNYAMSNSVYTRISQPHPRSGNAILWYFEKLCNFNNQEIIYNTLIDFFFW